MDDTDGIQAETKKLVNFYFISKFFKIEDFFEL